MDLIYSGKEDRSELMKSVQLTFTVYRDEYSEPLAIISPCFQLLFSKAVLLDRRSSRKLDFEYMQLSSSTMRLICLTERATLMHI